MVCFPLLAFLLLFPRAEGEEAPGGNPPVTTSRVSRRESPPLPPPPYLRLPVFVDSRLPLVDPQHFSPASGTGQEPLPASVRGLLLPAPPRPVPPGAAGASVTTRCRMNKMEVRVPRRVVTGDGSKDPGLKLGSCHTSNSTKEYLYFEYDLDRCGTKRKMVDNRVVYSNTLQYDPPALQGPIRRAAPFTLPVTCHFNRYQYSYKIGYTPKMQMHKIFKAMTNRVKFTLTARDAKWQRLSPSDSYVLGQPMYFEAEGPSMPPDQRLYVHSCYATRDKSHTSKPQFPVVNNFGCMVESKYARSRFHPHKNNVVRFSVDAFLFKGVMDQKLYMHCTMFIGSSAPTRTTKSCNYDTKAGGWVELHGKDVVCDCCDSGCTAAAPVETRMISSKPWTIEPRMKPTATPKRKRVSTTTTTTTTTTMTTTTTTTTTTPAPTRSISTTTPPPKTTTKTPHRMSTPRRPKAMAATVGGEDEDEDGDTSELMWPFGGSGVQWVEEEEVEEKGVKGSAVVEEEEDGEKVTEPYRTFEDIFEFDE